MREGAIAITGEITEETGVLITEEILEKNGFISDRKHHGEYAHYLSWCENYWVGMKRVNERLWHYHVQGDTCNIDGGLRYVHNLQMALDLSGIKVTINP